MIAGNIQKQPSYRKYVSELYDLQGTDAIPEGGIYCGNYPELTVSDLEAINCCLQRY
jgi:CDP-6-deoxy-D-xylo-4-hexulose-3-dehydrase